MRKITTLLIIIFAIVIILMSIFMPKSKPYIENEIKNSNYCSVDSDCVDAGGVCPFGCYVYVNKNEVRKISGLIESYQNSKFRMSECVYSCLACPTAVCRDNKCIELCE